MLNTLRSSIFLFFLLLSNIAVSQNIEGLQEIVKLQQDKISSIEDNLKKLIGSIEENFNSNKSNSNLTLIKDEINRISQKMLLLENKLKNITNLSYNLDFALKRVERHLELSSIQNNDIFTADSSDESNSKIAQNPSIKKSGLDTKTDGVLGFIKETETKENKDDENSVVKKKNNQANKSLLPKGNAEENYNYALDLASQLDFKNAEKAFKEFLQVHKESNKVADAQYWLGRVYFAQKKFEEAAIAFAEFNSIFPNDPRFQETTLLIAESAVNFAPKDQLCDILKQSLEFMVNPSDKFVKRINVLQNEKQCSTG